MSTLPPESRVSSAAVTHPGMAIRSAAGDELAARWAALHDAAGVVAMLTGLPSPTFGASDAALPAALRQAAGWRRRLAEQGLGDLLAIMQTGMAALLDVHARGLNAAAPAKALWDEFAAARQGLLELGLPTSAN